jgi:LacI family transcriptional regulator
MKPKTPTLKDIAKELGISISTVSRALRGMPEINLETREAVLNLSKNLSYKLPSSNTPTSFTHSYMLGAILPKIDNYHTSLIKGMDDAAVNAGFSLLVCQSNESYGREVSLIQRLLQQKVDGILISKSQETSNFEHFHKILVSNTPLVFVDKDCIDVAATKIITDYREGGYQVVKHLVEKGYKKLCYLGAKSYSHSIYAIENGILEALKEVKLYEYDKKLIFGDFDQKEAFEKTLEILRMNDKPDAIFAANDEIALGVFQAIQYLGYNIPKDIAVVGFFDDPMTKSFSPSISSVSVPSYEMGKLAVNTLLEQILLNQEPKVKPLLLSPKLEVRESSNQQRRFFGI